jgi:protein phosphatase
LIDATNVQPKARRSLLALAQKAAQKPSPATAIVLSLPVEICLARNQARPDRSVSAEVIEKQAADLLNSLPGLAREGFQHVYVMDNPEDIDSVRIVRQPG